MMMREFSFTIAVLFSIVSSGVDMDFVANAKQDPNTGEMKIGTLRGMPAAKGASGQLIVKMGPAKSWNEARKICKSLAPSGKWDLPESEAAAIAAIFVDPTMGFTGVNSNPNSKFYPMWVLGPTEEVTKTHLAGKAVALGVTDGTGGSSFAVDVQTRKLIEPSAVKSPALEKSLSEGLKNGLNVFCEHKAPPKAMAPSAKEIPLKSGDSKSGINAE